MPLLGRRCNRRFLVQTQPLPCRLRDLGMPGDGLSNLGPRGERQIDQKAWWTVTAGKGCQEDTHVVGPKNLILELVGEYVVLDFAK